MRLGYRRSVALDFLSIFSENISTLTLPKNLLELTFSYVTNLRPYTRQWALFFLLSNFNRTADRSSRFLSYVRSYVGKSKLRAWKKTGVSGSLAINFSVEPVLVDDHEQITFMSEYSSNKSVVSVWLDPEIYSCVVYLSRLNVDYMNKINEIVNQVMNQVKNNQIINLIYKYGRYLINIFLKSFDGIVILFKSKPFKWNFIARKVSYDGSIKLWNIKFISKTSDLPINSFIYHHNQRLQENIILKRMQILFF